MLVGEVWARMGLDSKQYEKDLNRLEADTKKRALTLGNVFRNAFSFTIGMGMFQAIQRGFQATVGEAVNFNSMMEQARIGFTTMLGSAEKAQAFLDDMADFAARTPFEFPDLLESSKRMLAMGFAASEILPTIEAVGNAAAGLGLGREGINRITLALGQMRAKAKVSGEEMRQLTEAGVPAWDMLAEALGMTTAEVMKMSERGLIPADKAIKIMVEGMNKRFPDMMKNMENTWQGVTSTIKDVWRMTMGTLTSGLFKGLTTWLQGVRDWATDFYNTFRQFGLQVALTKSFGAEFATMVNIVRSAVSAIVKHLSWWYKVLRQNWGMVKFVTTALLIYAAATKTAAIASGAFHLVTLALNGQLAAKIPLLSTVSTAVGIYRVQMHLAAIQGIVLTGVLAKLRVALYALHTAIGPIGWILLGLSAIAAGGIVMWGKYTKSLQQIPKVGVDTEEATDGANKALEDQADALKEAGKAANKNLQSFDEVHQLQEDMADTDAFNIDDVETPDQAYANMFDAYEKALEAQLEAAKPTLSGFWGWIKQGASNVWDGIKKKWSDFINWVKGWDVWDWLGQKWDGLKNIATAAWGGLFNVIAGIYQNMVTLTSSVWRAIWDYLVNQWNNIKTFAGNIWVTIRNLILGKIDLRTAISQIWEATKNFLLNNWINTWTLAANIWTAIKDFFANTWNSIKTAAMNYWNAILDFLGINWESIRQKANEIWTGIRDVITNLTAGVRDKTVEIWTKAKDTLVGLWDNIKRSAQDKWDGVRTVIKGAVNGIIGFINKFIKGWNKIELKIPSVTIPLVGTVGGWTVRVPQIPEIPMLAKGGLVNDPTLAMLGEAGPEAVVPLGRSGFADDLADTVAQAVYRAIIDAIRIAQASARQDDRELVLKIDNTVLARMQLPAIIREGQRQGLNLVVQPQGV